jgi:hypothetical protein
MEPDHWETTVVYFPTLKKYWRGGGGLNTEYKQGKVLLKGGTCKVTKTPGKVRKYFEEGATELIIVGHGADAADAGNAGKIIGGSWYCTPQMEAGELATGVFRNLGDQMKSVRRVWLWICQSSKNGVGVAVANALRKVAPKTTVYATPVDIGGIFYYMENAGRINVGQDSFVAM